MCSPSCLSSAPANPITRHIFCSCSHLYPVTEPLCSSPSLFLSGPLIFLTLLLVFLSSAWDGIGVNSTPLPDPVPVLAPVPVSAVDFCCGAGSALSPAPACRCLWRRQSWQREGSKMLGWNLGQMGSSPERGMLSPEGEPAQSSHPAEKTGK